MNEPIAPKKTTPKKVDPRKQEVRDALSRWLSFPTSPELSQRLRHALDAYELRAALEATLPPGEPSASPLKATGMPVVPLGARRKRLVASFAGYAASYETNPNH